MVGPGVAAAKSGNVGMLEALVERHSKGLLDHRCGAVGNSALHWAAAKEHLGALRWLLEQGAKLSLRNNSGATALHSAAANGASDCVDELLGRGADPEQVDNTGRTAHDMAARGKWGITHQHGHSRFQCVILGIADAQPLDIRH